MSLRAIRTLVLAALWSAAQAEATAAGAQTTALPEVSGEASEPLPPAGADGAPDAREEDPLFDDEAVWEDDEDQVEESDARDPWEGFNRGIFRFNRRIDYLLFDPITRGYRWAVPRPGRQAVERAFLNLDTPVILVNEIMQLRVVDAAGTVGRFAINTTAGVVGLFDPAGSDAVGIERTEADFGQTLGCYGTPSGPFLMLPVFGPSTVRDALGDVVDVMTDPMSYVLGPFRWWTLALGGSEGLVVRESVIDELNALEAGSLDFYSALRSAYLQSRDALIRESLGEDVTADAQLSPPAASFSIFASSATSSASRLSRFTIDTNSERRSASSLTVPSR